MDRKPRTFHFVNKHALSTSLSRSQGEARFELFRHARLEDRAQKIAPEQLQETQTSIEDDPSQPIDEAKNNQAMIPSSLDVVPLTSTSSDDRRPRHTPVLFRGSSDPFAAQAILITPRINELISFVRDVFLPGLYLTPFMRRFTLDCPKDPTIAQWCSVLGGLSARREWDQLRDGLSTEFGALAWISSWIPSMLQYGRIHDTQEWLLIGLQTRGRSIGALRDMIAAGTIQRHQIRSVFLHILWLFRADCVERNAASASIHANALRQLFEKVEDPIEQTQLLIVMMFNDTEMAISKLQRPLFDMETWVPSKLTELWEDGAAYLPETSPDFADLHHSIGHHLVREIAVRLRRCLAISETPFKMQDTKSIRLGDIIYNWMATYTLYDMGRLINIHLDLMNDADHMSMLGRQFTEAALALAVLHVLRKSMHAATINNVDIRDLSLVLVPRLKTTVLAALSYSTVEDLWYYQEAYLWMFYLGAQLEQRQIVTGSSGSLAPPDTWFTEMFIKQAQTLGIRTGSDIDKVLRMFVFDETLTPDLRVWFSTILATPE